LKLNKTKLKLLPEL